MNQSIFYITSADLDKPPKYPETPSSTMNEWREKTSPGPQAPPPVVVVEDSDRVPRADSTECVEKTWSTNIEQQSVQSIGLEES